VNTQTQKRQTQFKNYLDNKLIPFFGKIATQRHLLGVRNGIMAALPFILVGSIFTVLLNFPISFDANATDKYLADIMPTALKTTFDYINRFTFGIMSVYIAVGIGAELARLSRISSTQGAVIGLMGYILWMLPLAITIPAQIPADLTAGMSAEQIKGISDYYSQFGQSINGGLWLNIKNLGGGTAFIALVSSTLSVEIYRVCLKYKITIRMPKQVPEAVSNSFSALVPIIFIASIIGVIRFFVGFDLGTFLKDALEPIGGFLTTNVAGALLIVFLIAFLWWFGIHGGSLVQSITRPFWLMALEENQKALELNPEANLPNTFVEPFFQWFAQYGGAGNTLGLVIIGSIFAKSKQMSTISRTSLIPGIFNINEPILFGLPIILNPFMWIPFVVGPVLGASVGFGMQAAMGVHWVAIVPWTLPGPIGAFFASGSQWQAIVANLVVLVVSLLTWLPFVIANDRFLLKKERIDAEAKKVL